MAAPQCSKLGSESGGQLFVYEESIQIKVVVVLRVGDPTSLLPL
jgi:hypothetical protein